MTTPVADCSWWQMTGEYTPFDQHGISSPIFRNLETGELRASDALPAGALYAAPRKDEYPPAGADGLSIVCVLPDRQHWYIDGRANNCTMPDDKVHRCWCRHGTVGERLHVDKSGATCAAGGGSIQTSGWHGFLHDGKLVL